jgi:hypothetical protein
MEFPFGATVYRDRRPQVPHEYTPGETTPGSWDDASTIELPGAFVASSSSNAVPDATRSQILTAKSLYVTDPSVDVQPGDRIRAGAATYYVRVRPEADVNPFTGWQPLLEVPIEATEG